MRLIPLIIIAVILSASQAWGQDRHPHDWIRTFNIPGTKTDCCGERDCISLSGGALMGLRVGDKIALPAVGPHKADDVTIRAFYPSPDHATWGCHTGCFFIPGVS